MTAELISHEFQQYFNATPELIVRAPGRINLIGEHTDYNDGFVVPAAIDKAIWFAISKRSDKKIKLVAIDLDEEIEINLDNLVKTEKGWANYLIGVTKELLDSGSNIDTGFNVVFGGDVPLGAGLSSSAAVESGIGFALNELFDLKLDRKELALTAQRAEHNFAGVNCGIMDMYASLFGKADSVIQLDCQSLEHTYFPFDFPDYELVLCNTGVKHNLADSEYNIRRQECEEGLRILEQIHPYLRSLRDVTPDFFAKHRMKLPVKIMQRCRYVVCEIERVQWACESLLEGDLHRFGEYMYQTHWGLSTDYEVSCAELDFLVKNTETNDNVLGSRMMGGGFGGCTINIVRKTAVQNFIDEQKVAYKKAFGIEMETYVVALTDGVSVVNP